MTEAWQWYEQLKINFTGSTSKEKTVLLVCLLYMAVKMKIKIKEVG